MIIRLIAKYNTSVRFKIAVGVVLAAVILVASGVGSGYIAEAIGGDAGGAVAVIYALLLGVFLWYVCINPVQKHYDEEHRKEMKKLDDELRAIIDGEHDAWLKIEQERSANE